MKSGTIFEVCIIECSLWTALQAHTLLRAQFLLRHNLKCTLSQSLKEEHDIMRRNFEEICVWVLLHLFIILMWRSTCFCVMPPFLYFNSRSKNSLTKYVQGTLNYRRKKSTFVLSLIQISRHVLRFQWDDHYFGRLHKENAVLSRQLDTADKEQISGLVVWFCLTLI